LAEHTDLFRAEKIDGAVLSTLTEADLRELGLPLGDRKKLRAAIDALATAPEPVRAAAPRAAAEQRHLTVMFCDIVDSTRLAATLDLETLQDVVDAYQHQVASCAARYDGFRGQIHGRRSARLFRLSAGARGRCRARGPRRA
jgi:class 3 adenylate cyclase